MSLYTIALACGVDSGSGAAANQNVKMPDSGDKDSEKPTSTSDAGPVEVTGKDLLSDKRWTSSVSASGSDEPNVEGP